MKWTIFCLLLIFSINAHAIDKSKIGLAPLALTQRTFDCSSFLKTLENQKTINIAWLYNTFGRKYNCLKKILKDERLQFIETHLTNGPGHRNKRLEKHEFLKKYTLSQWNRLLVRRNQRLKKDIIKYATPVKNLLSLRVSTSTCLISGELEANISNQAGKVLNEWMREIFPDCLIVWNPIRATSEASSANADFIEQHSFNPKVNIPCIINLDGTDISFPSRISPNKKHYRGGWKNWIESTDLKKFLEKYNKCDIVFLWVMEYNCIDITKLPSSFKPPTQRICNQTKVNGLMKDFLESF